MILLLLNRIQTFFIPAKYLKNEMILKRARIFVNATLINVIFACFYIAITFIYDLINHRYSVFSCLIFYILLVWLFRYGLSLSICVTLYTITAYISCLFDVYWGGGLNSPVLSWMAMMPVVSLLMNNTKKSIIWVIIALLSIVLIGALSNFGYVFPQEIKIKDRNTFIVNTYGGLVVIIFFIALVFENGQSVALRKLNEQSILLAEEKKKTALYNVSQELHDNVGQTLTLVKVNLHTAILLEGEHSVSEKLNNALDLLTKVINDVREISHSMNMENLTHFNILDAIKNQVEALSKVGTYLTDFCISGIYHKLDTQTEFILFRIVQEVISNIIKHSQARSIQITACYEECNFFLTIKDDGIGINSDKFIMDGQGIRTIHSRAKLIGGILEIKSKTNEGTTINLNVPFPR